MYCSHTQKQRETEKAWKKTGKERKVREENKERGKEKWRKT